MKLTRRTFTTKDNNGCEFKCESYHSIENGIRESKYYAVGMEKSSITLKELKKIISNI